MALTGPEEKPWISELGSDQMGLFVLVFADTELPLSVSPSSLPPLVHFG